MEGFILPRNLVDPGVLDGRDVWMSALPGLVREFAEQWSLSVDGPFQPGGDTAWVAPAKGPTGEPLSPRMLTASGH